MSEMFQTTTETRMTTCECGTPVIETLLLGLYKGTRHWKKEAHSAPCGAPCISGGIHSPIRGELKVKFNHWTEGVHGWTRGEAGKKCPNGCVFP